jgi:hypothetical protein
MSIHQHDPDQLPDSEFIAGTLEMLVVGNQCRLLDARRTPGVIESVCYDTGMFRWRIIAFEDHGRSWDLPVEDVHRFQFRIGSEKLGPQDMHRLSVLAEKFNRRMNLNCSQAGSETLKRIESGVSEVTEWLGAQSQFLASGERLQLDGRVGSDRLADDLLAFMHEQGLAELEQITSEAYVLNPSSGEWFKGLEIVIAESGLKPYYGRVPRTGNVFTGIGEKRRRLDYVVARLTFMRGLFRLIKVREVILFRGMAAEGDWTVGPDRTFSSWTFSREVADSFASLESDSRFNHAYLLRRTFPIEKLFMTYLETRAMNNQYLEAEAVVLHDPNDQYLW